MFTHLNHTNPANDIDGAAIVAIRDAGMSVASDAQLLPL